MTHLLQHLEHFFSSLLSSKEFWAACLGAVIGGLLTGWFALFAQKQAAKDQRQRDQEAERRAVNGTLRAIKTELETFQNAFVKGMDEVLKKWDERYRNQTPVNLPSITQNYFIVFDASAAALGRIENEELRQNILGAFYEAKSLIEAINSLHQKYQSYEAFSRIREAPDEHLRNQLNTLKADLFLWTNDVIRLKHRRLQEKVPGVLNDIEKYLDREIITAF